MKHALLSACLLALAASAAPAQQQEQGLLDRIDNKGKRALLAMDGSSKMDPSLTSSLGKQRFGATSAEVKAFGTSSFGGLKSASVKSYGTRSFLGVRNPWFGKKIFDTYASTAGGRSARESSQAFDTRKFAVNDFAPGTKPDLADAATTVPTAAQPRPFVVVPKAQGGVDRFTQNVHKDLSIDDVRDLLNKGHGE